MKKGRPGKKTYTLYQQQNKLFRSLGDCQTWGMTRMDFVFFLFVYASIFATHNVLYWKKGAFSRYPTPHIFPLPKHGATL